MVLIIDNHNPAEEVFLLMTINCYKINQGSRIVKTNPSCWFPGKHARILPRGCGFCRVEVVGFVRLRNRQASSLQNSQIALNPPFNSDRRKRWLRWFL